MAYLCVRGRRGLIWGSSSFSASRIELFVTLNGKPTQRPSSWRGWKKRPWTSLLCGTTCTPLQADRGVAEWVSSLPASRVSRGAQPASASAPTTTAGSGHRSLASFAKWSHGSSFLRTSRGLFEEDFSTFSDPWPSSGSMRNGTCFRRPRRVPRSVESGFSFWPAATSTDAKASGSAGYSTESGRHSGTTLTDAIQAWPTPSARDGDPKRGMTARGSMNWARKVARGSVNAAGLLSDDLASSAAAWATPQAHERAQRPRTVDHGVQLANQVAEWPTPTAQDYGTNQGGSAGRVGPVRPSLSTLARSLPVPETPTDGAESSPSGRTSRPRLNPDFVDWLMGLPIGWTGCGPRATESCRNRQPSPSLNSGVGSMDEATA